MILNLAKQHIVSQNAKNKVFKLFVCIYLTVVEKIQCETRRNIHFPLVRFVTSLQLQPFILLGNEYHSLLAVQHYKIKLFKNLLLDVLTSQVLEYEYALKKSSKRTHKFSSPVFLLIQLRLKRPYLRQARIRNYGRYGGRNSTRPFKMPTPVRLAASARPAMVRLVPFKVHTGLGDKCNNC